MKNTLLISLLILSLNTAFSQSFQGKDFWLAFLSNNNGTSDLILDISSESGATGTVSIPLASTPWSQNFTVPAQGVVSITIPFASANHSSVSDAVSNKGIHVVSNTNDVIVYPGNYVAFSSDAATALPTNSLSNTYSVVAYGDQSFTNPSAFVITAFSV